MIPLTFKFRNSVNNRFVLFHGLFFEAEISTDIILSNGWMGANKLIPLPEWNQLGLRSGSDIFALTAIHESLGEGESEIDTTPMTLKGF